MHILGPLPGKDPVLILRLVIPDNRLHSIAVGLGCNVGQLEPTFVDVDWNVRGPIDSCPSGYRSWLRKGEFSILDDDVEERVKNVVVATLGMEIRAAFARYFPSLGEKS